MDSHISTRRILEYSIALLLSLSLIVVLSGIFIRISEGIPNKADNVTMIENACHSMIPHDSDRSIRVIRLATWKVRTQKKVYDISSCDWTDSLRTIKKSALFPLTAHHSETSDSIMAEISVIVLPEEISDVSQVLRQIPMFSKFVNTYTQTGQQIVNTSVNQHVCLTHTDNIWAIAHNYSCRKIEKHITKMWNEHSPPPVQQVRCIFHGYDDTKDPISTFTTAVLIHTKEGDSGFSFVQCQLRHPDSSITVIKEFAKKMKYAQPTTKNIINRIVTSFQSHKKQAPVQRLITKSIQQKLCSMMGSTGTIVTTQGYEKPCAVSKNVLEENL